MAIYYVRPDGNNTNLGTGYLASQGWATISKAASVMVAGDTVYIAPGTYRETVTPTNIGSAGLPISFIGDRKCQYFLDKTMGDVIISGMNAENDTAITRASGIAGGNGKNYINISNIDIENVNSYAIVLGTNVNILNCNMIKGIFWGVQLQATGMIINSKIFSTNQSSFFSQGTGSILINCILKCGSQSDVVFIGGAYTVELEHCIIEGAYNPGTASAVLNLYGCVWSCGSNPNVAGVVINLDVSTKLINSKGSTFIGRGGLIASSSPSTWYGTKFKDLYKLQLQVANTTSFCEFENSSNSGIQSSASQTISGCYFKNCLTAISSLTGTVTSNSSKFYGNSTLTSGTVTNNTPTYGETDVVAGIVASTTNPISGTKSLKIAGYDYGTVFTQWIPCEAGVPKTVKMKIKRPLSIVGTSIRLGDQVIQMTFNNKMQGTGWTVVTDASCNGGKYAQTNVKDNFIELSFSGNGVRLNTIKSPTSGIVGISIDGGVETNVDLYNVSPLYQQNVYEITDLVYGAHKIKVRVTGTKNASASNYYLLCDSFQSYSSSTWQSHQQAETPLIIANSATETIDVTYTHHKTELVPLFINTRVNTSGGDFVQYDDIQ